MNQRHYEALDGMRGLAAFAVVLFHMGVAAPIKAPSGFLAVDFFYVLSGFVIACAYDARLGQSLSFKAFMRLRFIRLYPIFALGALLAVLRAIALFVMKDPAAVPAPELGLGSILGLAFLPTPIVGAYMFLNVPAWSLMFELVANAAYALFYRWMTALGLVVIAGAGLAGIAAILALHGSLDVGAHWPDFPQGLARVTFSFAVGALLWRLRTKVSLPRIPVLPLLVILVAALCVPFKSGLYDLVFVVAISPLVVFLGSYCDSFPGAKRLGDISYPLYAIHFSLLSIGSFAGRKLHVAPTITLVGIIVAFSLVVPLILKLYDKPVRDFLARVTDKRRFDEAPAH
jgi:peptidoglycan/LPS O-acetylase OafA/YrhL